MDTLFNQIWVSNKKQIHNAQQPGNHQWYYTRVIFAKIQFDNILLYILNVVVFVATRVKSENMKVICIPTSFQVWLNSSLLTTLLCLHNLATSPLRSPGQV